MIFDALTLFSQKQAIADAAVSQASIDLGTPCPMSGNANGAPDLEIVLVPVETFAPDEATLTVEIRTSAERNAQGKLVDPRVVATTGPIAASDLKAGTLPAVSPRIPPSAERYVDLRYVPSEPLTAGAMTAGLAVTRATV